MEAFYYIDGSVAMFHCSLFYIDKETLKASTFELKEKQDYFKKKWLRDHVAIMVFVGICIIGGFVAGAIMRNSLIGYVAILMLVLAHGWRNNAMMTYVEKHAFDDKETSIKA